MVGMGLGVNIRSSFVVFILKGPSIRSIMNVHNNQRKEDAIKVGLQLLKAAEEFHKIGLIYGDFTPKFIRMHKQEDDGFIIPLETQLNNFDIN